MGDRSQRRAIAVAIFGAGILLVGVVACMPIALDVFEHIADFILQR